jgi:hypothetical protein
VTTFLTGFPGVNQLSTVTPSEMTRLNTGIPAVPADQQSTFGVAGGDLAGFPNGRRPGDDTVDIALRVVMGYLLPVADAPSGQLGFTDATIQEDAQFDPAFPYLLTPQPGAGG